jgi:cation diffusion facilitator CzcD-associated flavoprotein CzcO
MPADWPDFPDHARVRAWFESYVDAFGFRDRIALRTEVVSARPQQPSGWLVSLRGPDGVQSERRYDALVACSGSYWHPRMPAIPGDFEGELFHAQHYRDPATPVDLRGKRVLVIGIGNTGCELASEIAAGGAETVLLSARSGTWIMPKRMNGRPTAARAPMMHPCDPIPTPMRVLPRSAREWLFGRIGGRMIRKMLGERMQRFAALGLPPPPANPQDKRATICDPILSALESGAVVARPGIERFAGKEVIFQGGTRERADVVLCATGYHLRYPYLPADLVDTRADDLTLFLGTMHPRRHDLFVIGVSRPTGGFWPIAEVHAQVAAARLSGRYALPAQREIDRRSRPILRRRAFNPALYGLEVKEELARGARRAARRTKSTSD